MLVLLAIVLSLSAQARPPTGEEIRAALAELQTHATYPLPLLSASRLEALVSGEVVRTIDRPAGAGGLRRASALMITAVDRDLMWLSCQDPHFSGDPSVKELRLELKPPDDAIWFGIADLPAPVSDRRWVVRSWNNHALAESTNGRAWEHPWKSKTYDASVLRQRVVGEELPEVDAEAFDEAVPTGANHGAFLAVRLAGGHTLFGYHTTFDPGGHIPDWMVARWAHAGLETAFRRYEKRAREIIPEHFSASHAPVYGGDGQPVMP